MAEAIETAIYKMGVQEADYVRGMRAASAADLEKIKSGEGVVASEEKVEKSTRTTTQGLERRLARMSEVIRVQQQFDRDLAYHRRIEEEGIGTAKQRALHLELVTRRYHEANQQIQRFGSANKNAAGQTGLLRHELINMSRQVQDIGVSLASGQSPFTVLVQQGTQVADIFASSQGTVRGFFGQVFSGIGRVLTPLRLAAGGIAALGTSAVLAASDWQSAQTDINRSLQGIGRASGVTVADINKIGSEASSALGLSTKEAMEFATTLAATGKIGGDTLTTLTRIGHDFAATLRLDVAEAAKVLAGAFADPVKGADELGKRLGGMSPLIREQIAIYTQLNQRAEAQRVLTEAIIPQLARASEVTGFWSASWTGVTNAASEAWTAFGQVMSSLTGIGQEGNARLVELQERYAKLIETINNASSDYPLLGRLQEQAQRTAVEIAKLQAEVERPALEKGAEAFRNLAEQGQRFADAADRDTAVLRSLTSQLAIFNEVLNSPNRDLVLSSEQVAQWERARDAVRAQVTEIQTLKSEYGGVSIQVGRILAQQQAQLAIAQAVTGQERLAAQQAATLNSLKAQKIPLERQSLIAVNQRAIAEAQINANAERQLVALRQQYELIRASSEEERNRIAAAQTYTNLINDGVDAERARAVAQQQFVNAQEQARQAAEGTAEASNQAAGATQNVAIAAQHAAEEYERAKAAIQAFLDFTKFVPNSVIFGPSNYVQGQNIFVNNQGFASQFRPEGYESSFNPLAPTGLGPSSPPLLMDPNSPLSRAFKFMDDAKKQTGEILDSIFNAHDQLQADLTRPAEERQIEAIEKQLESLRGLPKTPEREQAIMKLVEALDRLKGTTEALNSTMQATLDPLFSQGRDAIQIGYYKAATGLEGIVQGTGGVDSVPVHVMATPGERVSFTPPGQEPKRPMVETTNRTTVINQMISFPASAVGERRRSARQLAEGFSRGLASVH